MQLIDPDDVCLCGSGISWSECCASRLPLTLRYVPVRILGPDDAVRVGCSAKGHCCREVHVPLTAFDTLRLASTLELTMSEVLNRFAVVNSDGVVEIEGSPQCPFLDGDVCTVYSHRPDSCRMYPFWWVTSGDAEWLVERHTCAGCWRECRGATVSAHEFLISVGVEDGRRAESLFQAAIGKLEDSGASDEVVEAFMAAVYHGDRALALIEADDTDRAAVGDDRWMGDALTDSEDSIEREPIAANAAVHASLNETFQDLIVDVLYSCLNDSSVE